MIDFFMKIAESPAIVPLAWSLLHSLWQILIISALAFSVLKSSKHLSSADRYGILAFAMAAIPASFIATLTKLTTAAKVVSTEQQLLIPMENDTFTETASLMTTQWMALLILIWLTGMCLLSLRVAGGIFQIHRLKNRHSKPLQTIDMTVFYSLCKRLNIRIFPVLRETTKIASPLLVGMLRPVILVPTGLFTGLPPEQIECILLHELAHLKRKDYLVNLLQHVIEIVFFFHPCVWWLSNSLRAERENCCDDLVVKHSGDATSYAKALLSLGSQMHIQPTLAMSATGRSPHNLYHRIKHILEDKPMSTHPTGRLIAVLLIASGICLLSGISALTLHAATADETIDREQIVKVIRLNSEDIDGDGAVKTIEDIIATVDASLDGVVESSISETVTAALESTFETIEMDLDATGIKILDLSDDSLDIEIEDLITKITNDIECSAIIDLTDSDHSDAVKITIENGEIVSVTDKGREVPESEFDQYTDMIPNIEVLEDTDSTGTQTMQILRFDHETDTSDDENNVIKKIICVKTEDSEDNQ